MIGPCPRTCPLTPTPIAAHSATHLAGVIPRGRYMTDTEPSTRPIHERWAVDEVNDPSDPTAWWWVSLDGDDEEAWPMRETEGRGFHELLAAAGKTHAVLVDLPDCAGGGQLVTWSYPNGAVEASWRQSAHHTWVPVELLDGGSVVVAP